MEGSYLSCSKRAIVARTSLGIGANSTSLSKGPIILKSDEAIKARSI